MIRNPQEIRVKLPTADLYLEDIQAIVDALKAGGRGKVVIRSKKYTFRDVDDLRNADERVLNDLLIIHPTTGCRVVVTKNEWIVYAPEDTVVNEGVVAKITKIIRSRRNWMITVLSSFPFGIFAGGVFGLAVRRMVDDAPLISFVAILAVVCYWCWWFRFGRVRIVTQSRRDHMSMAQKLIDHIPALIIAVIGAVLGSWL